MTTNTNLTSQGPYKTLLLESIRARRNVEPFVLACMIYNDFTSRFTVPPRYWLSELLGIYLQDPRKINRRQLQTLIELEAIDKDGNKTDKVKPALCSYLDSVGAWKVRQELGIGEILDATNKVPELEHRQMIADFNKQYGWTYEDKELTRLLEERARLPKIEPNVDLDEEENVF